MLKLTATEANEMRKKIEGKKLELKELGKYKASAYESEGDGFHDNFAFEQAEIQERGILREISDLQKMLDEAEIINLEEQGKNESNQVMIGSEVILILDFNGEKEQIRYVITGGFGDIKRNIISIESPLGKCIMNKTVGFKGEYVVNGYVTKVEIIEIT